MTSTSTRNLEGSLLSSRTRRRIKLEEEDNDLGANEYWSTPIRDHMLKFLVERTQKAGKKLIDKSLPFGPNDKFDTSNAFLHGKENSAPRNRALFNFMNQACGRYDK